MCDGGYELVGSGGACGAGSTDVEGGWRAVQPHPRWEKGDIKQEWWWQWIKQKKAPCSVAWTFLSPDESIKQCVPLLSQSLKYKVLHFFIKSGNIFKTYQKK